MHVASPLQPTEPQIDVTSDEVAEFRHGPSGSIVTVRRAPLKSALVILADQWPQSVAVRDLPRLASGRSGMTITDEDRRALAELLLRSFVKNLIVLHMHPPRVVSFVSDQPAATVLARLQAASNQPATTQLHDTAHLDNTHCQILAMLDGTRDPSQLCSFLVEQTLKGELKLQKDDDTIADSVEVRRLIENEIVPCLERLAKNALLVG
jgi:hypothetical protein